MNRFLIVCLVLSPFLSVAQVTQTSGGYKFRAKFSKGQLISWATTGKKVAGAGGPISISSPFLIRVLSVSGGTAYVHAKSGPVLLNGKQFQDASENEGNLDARMRPLGALDQAGAFSGMFPERAIPIGGSWTAPLQITTGNLPGNSVATYKLSRFATVDGVKVAVLATTLTGLLQGSGETMVRVSDGIPQRMTLNLGLTLTKGPDREYAMRLKFDVVRK